MTSKFALIYAKYTMAINSDTVDDKLRDEFSKAFNEEPEIEKNKLIEIIINMIFDHYKKINRLDLAKEECLKLKFEKYLPNPATFGLILDLLSIRMDDGYDVQLDAMRDVIIFIKERDEYLDSLYKGVYQLMLQRLLVLSEDGVSAINFDPDLSSEIISSLEKLEDVEYFNEFLIWYQ